jgi:hypothetical protein
MQAALWGMEHFSSYLWGCQFILFTDHHPLEKLGQVQSKMLNCLQEVMQKFNFQIIYKKGSEMPIDYMSRNLVEAITWQPSQIQQEQETDPLIQSLK